MPFDNSGNYIAPSLPDTFNPAVDGGTQNAADFNTLRDDQSAALSMMICKDGQSTVTADIPMSGHKLTGLANGSSPQDAATVSQIGQTVAYQTGAVSGGTGTITFSDSIPQQSSAGDQVMYVTITPKSATSTLVIEVDVNICNSVSANAITVALFQDSAANALKTSWATTQAANAPLALKLRHTMISGTTSPITFKVRVGANAASTTTFNGQGGARIYGGTLASCISVREGS